MLGHEPGKAGEVFLVLRELGLRHAFKLFVGVHVAVLNEHAANHVLVHLAVGRLLDFADFEQADVLGLVLEEFESVVVKGGGEEDFHELALEEFGRLEVDLAGHGNHGTERRHRVTCPGGFHGFAQRFAGGESTGVHVLHDDDCVAVAEFACHLEGGIRVDDVVVRKFLAPELLCGGETCFGAGRVAVEHGRLVGIFSVAHRYGINEFQNEFFGHDFSFDNYRM